MRLVLDSEQQQLRDTVRKLLTDAAPPGRVREVLDDPQGIDRPLWRRLAGELGLAGLVVPERWGGAGAGHVERGVVLEELGRVLAPVPFLSSAVLAVDTVLALGDEELAEEVLPPLVSGASIGTIAVSGVDGGWGSAESAVRAQQRDGGWALDGQASFVVSGNVANLVLVYAGTPDGPGWFVVGEDAAGLTATVLRALDPTRRLARLDFAATPARRADTADPRAVLEAVRDRAAVALAAEQVGGMTRVLELTVAYAKVRVQFGRTIGSYQAVKHACADLYSACERATSLLRHAAWAADHAPEELPLAAATVQVYIGPAYFAAAADGVMLHGGIGYTWEHDAHLYYKRAKTSELLFGDTDQSRDRLAGRLAI